MFSDRISTGIFTTRPRPSPANLRARFVSFIVLLFATVTLVAIFVPLNPRMPSANLDASWEFAMNQAVARNLSFGKDVMFTYGPYASICTRIYDPSTDLRMMLGSLIAAISYGAALFYLSRGTNKHTLVILLLLLATYDFPELLLLSYPFLLILCVLKYLSNKAEEQSRALRWPQFLKVIFMWSALGYLPVIKGSLLLPYAVAVVVPPFLLILRKSYKAAILLCATPIFSSLALWIIARQPITNVPAFLRGTVELTSGYTEAMSTAWTVIPTLIADSFVIACIAAGLLIFVSIGRSVRLSSTAKIALTLACAIFLLVIFKHGFVAVGNVSGVFCSVSVLIVSIGFLHIDRLLVSLLVGALVVTVGTSIIHDQVLVNEVHARFGVGATWSGQRDRPDILKFCLQRAMPAYGRATFGAIWNTYVSAGHGLILRLHGPNALEDKFAAATVQIRNQSPVPMLQGSVDIYNVDQSSVLASGNQWNPRPVLQSYSAYTKYLSSIDEQHLRGPSAPDWILFDLQSIDGRLPSLDDGMSWPALFDNYSSEPSGSRFSLLHKHQTIYPASTFTDVSNGTYRTGATVNLPELGGPIFAELSLKPTLAGKVLIALFNPPLLHITVGLDGGRSETYRTVSNMMATGFLITPLIHDTSEFTSLLVNPGRSEAGNKVRSIAVNPVYGGSLFWSSTYDLRLKRYISP